MKLDSLMCKIARNVSVFITCDHLHHNKKKKKTKNKKKKKKKTPAPYIIKFINEKIGTNIH